MKRSRSDLLFDITIYAILTLLLLCVAYPLYFVLIASISDPTQTSMGNVILYPRGFTLDGYREMIAYKPIWTGYRNTILYTIAQTLLSTSAVMMAGFALSNKRLMGRSLVMRFMTFTMFFSGGLVPTYLVVDSLGLNGSPLVIVLLGSVSVYNIIIARTFMQTNLPDSLREAAAIDGCRHARFFFSVALPLSPALISVMVLFSAVGQWNAWFNAMIYLRDERFLPLQLMLRRLLSSMSSLMTQTDIAAADGSYAAQALLAESMKYAVIIVSSVPILLLYPFVQKHFTKGVMLGAMKG